MDPSSNSYDSPYLADGIELQPPSPSSTGIQLDPLASYDFTTSIQATNDPSSSPFIGSYNNSPYSVHSELSYNDDHAVLFASDPTIREYDPSEYDTPHTNSLLIFNDTDYMNPSFNPLSVSLSAATVGLGDHRSTFDYGSPASTTGSNQGAESGAEGADSRSRASSVASSRNHSPRLTNGFENLTFSSPHWNMHRLPNDRSLSPPQKPQSPPQLLIPDSTGPRVSSFSQNPPVLNPAAGLGPQLHVVPATPVSMGAASNSVPFQNTLETLRQGSSLNTSSSWDHPSDDSIHQYNQSAAAQLSHPSAMGLSSTSNMHSTGSVNLSYNDPSSENTYLLPSIPRARSRSDPSIEPPTWDTDVMRNPIQSMYRDNPSALIDKTVNLNDILPGTTQNAHSNHVYNQPTHNAPASYNQSPHPPPLNQSHSYTFASNNPSSPFNQNSFPPDFLSPDMAGVLRRSKSDASSAGGRGHTRQSRSEDIRASNPSSFLYPPSAHQDFISQQFLSPNQDAPQTVRGHFRRASSGSRSDRGSAVGGNYSNNSSTRPSPYPSPNVSPNVVYDELPNVQQQQQHHVRGSSGKYKDASDIVAKPNVTTGRTANASHKRRTQPANFVCPVPGCGSTFTRSFNLKGHIRSHNDEKPFQCPWPGCGKGFARQHDCKRHEQLHTNYRPFTCDGCQKQFARMDALNRHLRSEGGVDCKAKLEASGIDVESGTFTLNASGDYGRHSRNNSANLPGQLPVPIRSNRLKAEEELDWGSVTL